MISVCGFGYIKKSIKVLSDKMNIHKEDEERKSSTYIFLDGTEHRASDKLLMDLTGGLIGSEEFGVKYRDELLNLKFMKFIDWLHSINDVLNDIYIVIGKNDTSINPDVLEIYSRTFESILNEFI